MEATNLEVWMLFLIVLSAGSSIIHYSAFAKARAKVKSQTQVKEERSS